MRRLSRSSRIATAIAALTVTALVPLCGVAQAAAPSHAAAAPAAAAPAPSGGDQDGNAASDQRLVKLGNRDGMLGLGVLGLL
ncbi:hypothetical protein [Streptomyces reniochalinae]|uniref:Uncharacterized protein n=1 Tax=Streptomyces reniochalinae TaxID=2250578 RepID=A0A367F4F8_9ACTN|nr:hypothetical protein [Streptomyces reniochalinae]RCG25233.1 hypothetical protein DQ392_01625 [Streptomyces reniochalinae]